MGDWVRIKALWPGVWRVDRVLSGVRENRWSLNDPIKISDRLTVFCHRLVNDEWKRSFSFQSCDASLVECISDEERERAESLLSVN